MAKRFVGRAQTSLLTGYAEPIRIWFEFYKAALQDPELEVHQGYYQHWKANKRTDFDEWFYQKDNWKQFSMPAGVQSLTKKDDLNRELNAGKLVLSIDPHLTQKEIIDQVKERLAKTQIEASAEDRPMIADGPYTLTGKTQIKAASLRQYLYFYQKHIEGYTINDIVRMYVDRAVMWNDKVRENNWNRTLIPISAGLMGYYEDFLAGGSILEDNRRVGLRALQRGKKIAANVADGKFPGAYQ